MQSASISRRSTNRKSTMRSASGPFWKTPFTTGKLARSISPAHPSPRTPGRLPDRIHPQCENPLRRPPSAEHHFSYMRCLGRVAAGEPIDHSEAMYHFISGYTARVAGTEVGVKEPQATFSACFSAAFLVRHPTVYAEMLAAKLRGHDSQTWLVNTGWTGGPFGVGSRMKLSHTRAIIDAIHSGALADAPTVMDPVFRVAVPTRCPGVPNDILQPRSTWPDSDAYEEASKKLAGLFRANFQKYADQASDEIKSAEPGS